MPEESYKEFFGRHISYIRNNNEKCLECGCALSASVREVAHILPKSYFKSISVEDNNIIYLCELHHNDFDNRSNKHVKEMSIFPVVAERFQQLLPQITESINYKIYDKYE